MAAVTPDSRASAVTRNTGRSVVAGPARNRRHTSSLVCPMPLAAVRVAPRRGRGGRRWLFRKRLVRAASRQHGVGARGRGRRGLGRPTSLLFTRPTSSLTTFCEPPFTRRANTTVCAGGRRVQIGHTDTEARAIDRVDLDGLDDATAGVWAISLADLGRVLHRYGHRCPWEVAAPPAPTDRQAVRLGVSLFLAVRWVGGAQGTDNHLCWTRGRSARDPYGSR
jgi:hypothetical protein